MACKAKRLSKHAQRKAKIHSAKMSLRNARHPKPVAPKVKKPKPTKHQRIVSVRKSARSAVHNIRHPPKGC
jgi:hypothetical protein